MKEAVRRSTILERLLTKYGSPETELHYSTTLELLIATILSAQCTDVRVNLITPSLFAKYPSVVDYAEADLADIARLIKTCGLYRNKSRFIVEACQKIVSEFGGEVPSTRKELETLPGVGRKTANVVIANAFGQDAIAVDTHVFRVTRRLGFAEGQDVWQVEQELMKTIPQKQWSDAHHWFILHGRQVCKARKPLCESCHLLDLCHWADKELYIQN